MARKAYQSGIVYSRLSRYDAAKVYYQRVIDEYTDTDYGAKAAFQIAQCELSLHNYGEACRRFENFCTVYAGHPWVTEAARKAAEATYKEAVAAFNTGDTTAARAKFDKLLKDFPASKYAGKANKYLDRMSVPDTAQAQVGDAGS